MTAENIPLVQEYHERR